MFWIPSMKDPIPLSLLCVQVNRSKKQYLDFLPLQSFSLGLGLLKDSDWQETSQWPVLNYIQLCSIKTFSAAIYPLDQEFSSSIKVV